MQMSMNLAPNKHMLDLNFDEDSSDEENQNSQGKQQKPKFQKVYDLDVDYTNLKRDKFTINKVQKGLFINEAQNCQYDTFEVKHKPQRQKLNFQAQNKSKSVQKTPLKHPQNTAITNTILKINHKSISLQFLQKSSSDEKDSMKDSLKSQTQKTPQKKLQSQTLLQSKKKLLQLDFSQSSSEEQDNESNSAQKQQKNLEEEQKQKKKPLIRKKQAKKQQKESLQGQQEQQQQKQQEQSEQEQEQQVERPAQKPQILVHKDFAFNKQAQYDVLDQIRPQQRVRAIISRCRSGLNLIWPQYQIRTESTQQQILYVKKQIMFFKSIYLIYCKTLTGQNRYFGRLQTNMSGTEYQVFLSENGIHETLKAEMYFPNDSKRNQPRYFIMLSLIDGYSVHDLVGNVSSNHSLKDLYNNQQNKNKIMLLHSRKPIFNQHIRGFVLNFAGRVTMPSIKNFILQDVNTQKEVLMFGKMDKDNFRLQISSPLNCVLGTAVALIQFEGRFME